MAEHLVIGDIWPPCCIVLGFTGPLLAPLLRVRWLGRLRVFAHPLVALPAVDDQLLRLAPAGALSGRAAPRPDPRAPARLASSAFGIAMWMALLGPLPKPALVRQRCAGWLYIIAVRLAGTVLANVLIFSGTRRSTRSTDAGDAHWHISPHGRPDRRRRRDDGRGEPAHDRPVLLAVPEGRPRGRGAPAAARRGRRARTRARRASRRRGAVAAGAAGAAGSASPRAGPPVGAAAGQPRAGGPGCSA